MKFTSLSLFYIVVALSTTSFPSATYAVDPSEILDNPILEKRARHISKDLRCLVCQNQSIDDSDANLARDLRLLVRERLIMGDTDYQVIDYVVSRYGDFVLLRPPVSYNRPIVAGTIDLCPYRRLRFDPLFSASNRRRKK